jgi:hypothetical protein
MTVLPELFKRLKPLYGTRIDQLWFEFQLADPERKQEISNLLTVLAIKRLGIGIGEERIVLDPPPASVIGRGTYTVGTVSYPGLAGYEFRLAPEELLRHLFILGPTGTGKSTLIIGLLQQLLLDGVPFMCFDFKRNYRCLLDAPRAERLVVITVGRDIAPLRVNALQPPPGVEFEEWIAGLADLISTSYLLMQGARNVLIEGFRDAHRERGTSATFLDAHRILDAELQSLRAGSRRYGWLESSARSLEELTRGGYGAALNAHGHGTFADLLGLPVVFELQGLGDDQKRFFCLFALHAVLQLRKNDNSVREVLRHVLVFDEAHNIFPKEQFGQLGVPSRLAREVREYGEAIIAATQQADIAESLIANSGTKIILRTDYPKDVDFASKLLQIEPRWLAKLPLGTGIARLPTRYYSPFLFTFPPQPRKNTLVADNAVRERYTQVIGDVAQQPPAPVPSAVTDKEGALLRDIAQYPIAGITARYQRLGWHPMVGTDTKNSTIKKDLATFDDVPTGTGRIRILTLTRAGIAHLAQHGVTLPSDRRGGAAHEYWRATIRLLLERHAYTTTAEFPVGEGRTVDLHATKGDHEVFVEVETGKSDISANIKKCAGLPGVVIFFFLTNELRSTWQDQLPGSALALTPGELDQLAETLR